MRKHSILIISLLLLLLCSSCVDVKPPITTFKKYEVKKINLVSATFHFIFDIENPNDIPLDIKSIEYILYIEGNHFLNGESEGFSLLAKEEKEIFIPIEISYLGVLESVAEIARKLIIGNKKLMYKLEGNLVIESLGASAKVPLNAQGELVLIKLP